MARPEITGRDPGADALPAELYEQTAADGSLGYSPKPEDQQIPQITVLQGGSPEVDKRGDSYMPGAEAGKIWLHNHVNPFRDSIEAQLCGMFRGYIEWLPNRQGFVDRYSKLPSDIENRVVKDGGYERPSLVRPNGNLVVDTRELYFWAEDAPWMLSCFSTKHAFAKKLNGYCAQFKHPQTGIVLPTLTRKYRLRTVPAANAKGKWFDLTFDDLGWVSLADYQAAHTLAEIIKRGVQRVELSSHDDDGDAAPAAPVVQLAPGPKSAPGAA